MNLKKVRIKTWEELLATPGISLVEGDIRGPDNTFVSSMEYLCGKEVELEKVELDHPYGEGFLGYADGWNINKWMVVDKSENFNQLYNKLNGN